jgi:hypothetical protein
MCLARARHAMGPGKIWHFLVQLPRAVASRWNMRGGLRQPNLYPTLLPPTSRPSPGFTVPNVAEAARATRKFNNVSNNHNIQNNSSNSWNQAAQSPQLSLLGPAQAGALVFAAGADGVSPDDSGNQFVAASEAGAEGDESPARMRPRGHTRGPGEDKILFKTVPVGYVDGAHAPRLRVSPEGSLHELPHRAATHVRRHSAHTVALSREGIAVARALAPPPVQTHS